MKKKQRAEFEAPLVGAIASQAEGAFSLLTNGPDSVDAADPIRQHTYWPAFTEIWRAAKEVADRENFLHWEVAFPGVWHRWQDDDPVGGFDAVIGNPPWDQIRAARGRMVRHPLREMRSRLPPPLPPERRGTQGNCEFREGRTCIGVPECDERQAQCRPPRPGVRGGLTLLLRRRPTSTSTPSSSNVPCVWSNRTASSAC